MKRNFWNWILIFSTIGVASFVGATTTIFDAQNHNEKRLLNIQTRTSVNDTNALISFPTGETINASLQVFLKWCHEWIPKNGQEQKNLKNWLIEIGFIVDSSVSKITLLEAPNVQLDTSNNHVQSVTINFSVFTNNNGFSSVPITLSNEVFKPNIGVPNAINLYIEDFISELENQATNVNKFLANYGFNINKGIVEVQYSNTNFNPQEPEKFYNSKTGDITIQFLQYQDQSKNVTIYQPITFNIKNIHFKLPLKNNPGGIIGILLGLAIIACLISYITIKSKRYIAKKKNQARIIPAWKIDKDKQNKIFDEEQEQSDIESSIIDGTGIKNINDIDENNISENIELENNKKDDENNSPSINN